MYTQDTYVDVAKEVLTRLGRYLNVISLTYHSKAGAAASTVLASEDDGPQIPSRKSLSGTVLQAPGEEGAPRLDRQADPGLDHCTCLARLASTRQSVRNARPALRLP